MHSDGVLCWSRHVHLLSSVAYSFHNNILYGTFRSQATDGNNDEDEDDDNNNDNDLVLLDDGDTSATMLYIYV
jgi:hypothetical protein